MQHCHKKGLKILTVLFIPDKWQKYATSMELQAEVWPAVMCLSILTVSGNNEAVLTLEFS